MEFSSYDRKTSDAAKQTTLTICIHSYIERFGASAHGSVIAAERFRKKKWSASWSAQNTL
jgi:hypothetical protein